MIVADKIAEWLHEKGIETAYGIIGAGNLAIFDAISRLQKTRLVCTHHEQAAVMAAGFHWRTNRQLCAAIVTTGAGSSNAITGVLAAFMDSTPLIVISGNEPSAAILHGKTRTLGVQGYDSTHLIAGNANYVERHYSGDISVQLERCWREALGMNVGKRMGPVWLDVPRDVQTANA